MSSSRSRTRLRILQGLILFAPLPFGSAPEPFATLFFLFLVFWIALAWPDARQEIPLPGGKWLGRLVLTIPFLAILQLVPLPRGFVGFLHPGALPLLESLPMEVPNWLCLSLAPGLTWNAALQLLVLALFFLTLLRLPIGRQEARSLVVAMLISGAVQVVVGAVRMVLPVRNFFLFFYPVDNPLPWAQLTGTFVENSQAALFVGMGLLACLGYWGAEAGLFSSRGPKPATLKQWVLPGSFTGVYVVLIGVCIAGFALTRSKNMFWLMTVAAVAAVLLWFLTQFPPQQRDRLRWIFLVAIVLAMTMGMRNTQARFFDQQTGKPVQIRTDSAVKKMIRDFPILGSGWGTFARVNTVYINRPEFKLSHARNEWMQIAVEGGLLSAGILLSTLLLFLWGVWRRWTECLDRWSRGMSAGMLAAAMLLWGLTPVYYPLRVPCLVFLVLLAMGVAARLTVEDKKR